MIPLDDLIGCFSFVRENSIKSFVLLNFGGKLQHMNGYRSTLGNLRVALQGDPPHASGAHAAAIGFAGVDGMFCWNSRHIIKRKMNNSRK